MVGWLLVAVALAALFLDPGLGGTVVVAAVILVYLIVRARSWDEVREDVEIRDGDRRRSEDEESGHDDAAASPNGEDERPGA